MLVPRLGTHVLYYAFPGDRFGDLHEEGEPILAVVAKVRWKDGTPLAAVRLFPDADTVPLRRDVRILAAETEELRHCIIPLDGDTWPEHAPPGGADVSTAEPALDGDSTAGPEETTAAPPTPQRPYVIQRQNRQPPRSSEDGQVSAADVIAGKK